MRIERTEHGDALTFTAVLSKSSIVPASASAFVSLSLSLLVSISVLELGMTSPRPFDVSVVLTQLLPLPPVLPLLPPPSPFLLGTGSALLLLQSATFLLLVGLMGNE